jgi:ribosomal protein S18 acetylase RimI-like enzyme
MFTIKTLTKADISLLINVADDVFDNSVNENFSAEFLNDPRHHIVVAIVDEKIVGFASAIHYIHPDKPAELWINEVGVSGEYQKQGIAKAIMKEMFQVGKTLGCKVAWVLTESDNIPANNLYKSVGGKKFETVLYEFDI